MTADDHASSIPGPPQRPLVEHGDVGPAARSEFICDGCTDYTSSDDDDPGAGHGHCFLHFSFVVEIACW
jgi:hypothetical protein